MPFRAHLHTVNRHRRLVRHYCFKLGLVWQGLGPRPEQITAPRSFGGA